MDDVTTRPAGSAPAKVSTSQTGLGWHEFFERLGQGTIGAGPDAPEETARRARTERE